MKEKDQIKSQKQIFTKISQGFKKYSLENYHRCYLKKIFQGLKIPSKGIFLDISCGALGYLIIEAARLGQKGVGLDLNRNSINKAKLFAKKELPKNKNYNFLVGRAEKLPFKKNSFTKISAIALLEHIFDDNKAIREVARVLKKNGRLFITVPNAFSRIPFCFRWYYHLVDKKMGHLRHYEAITLAKKFQNYGLKLVKINYTGHLPKIIQFFLTLIFPFFDKTHFWWELEKLDLQKAKDPSGVHFDLIMRKGTNEN